MRRDKSVKTAERKTKKRENQAHDNHDNSIKDKEGKRRDSTHVKIDRRTAKKEKER